MICVHRTGILCQFNTLAGCIMIDISRETKHVENSISRAADRKNQYYSLLYSEMAERKRVEEHLRRSKSYFASFKSGPASICCGQ